MKLNLAIALSAGMIGLFSTPVLANPGANYAQKSTVIQEQSQPSQVAVDSTTPSPSFHALANSLIRGLAIANRMGEIRYSAYLSYQVQDVVWLLRRGVPLDRAAQKADVSQATIDRLLQLDHSQQRPAWVEAVAERSNYAIANALVRGLATANRTGEIAYTARLSYQVQDVVRLLRRGVSLESAVNRGGVAPHTIDRLLELGNYQ